MVSTAHRRGPQLVSAFVLALVGLAVPLLLDAPAPQAVAAAVGGGLLTYFMRGRDRRRSDLVLGVGLIVLLGLVGVAAAEPAAAVAWWGAMPLGWVLRREREERRDPRSLSEPLTGWRGRLAVAALGVLMVGSVVWVVVTVWSGDDVVDLLGPPAAVAIAGVLGSVLVALGGRRPRE